MAILVALAGGLETFFTSYILSVSKNFTLEAAIKTGDGPWQRYLVDLMIVSPGVLILALASVFQLRPADPRHRPLLYSAIFIGVTYLIMCNLKYGMNLRYANMWDAPLRLLAFAQLGVLAQRVEALELFGIKKSAVWWMTAAILALCAAELRQYWILGIRFNGLYELVTEILLRAVHILK